MVSDARLRFALAFRDFLPVRETTLWRRHLQEERGCVLVTGASGFVGRHVVRQLVGRGFQVRALVRSPGGAERFGPLSPRVTEVIGNTRVAASLAAAVTGCTAVIHLVGIIAPSRADGTFYQAHVVSTRNVLDTARGGRVERLIHMSALGARPDAPSRYHRTKWEADELVKKSGLAWSIFRPGLIIGADSQLVRMVRGWVRGRSAPFLFMPYFGAGVLGQKAPARVQPILVDDVAALFVDALTNERAVHKTYCIGGPEQFTWPEMYKLLAQQFCLRTKRTAGIPAWLASMAAAAHLPGLPFTKDQLLMSQEDNICDLAAVRADFPNVLIHSLKNSPPAAMAF